MNQIENEIFKEIEERDQEESSIKTNSSQPEENVTKRFVDLHVIVTIYFSKK